MRNFLAPLCLAGVLVLVGCGKEQSNTPAPAPAPAATSGNNNGYLGAMVKSQQVAVKAIDTAALNQEVTLFQAQEGRYPKDLNELVTMHYIGKLPEAPVGMKLKYDATQGKVSVVPQ